MGNFTKNEPYQISTNSADDRDFNDKHLLKRPDKSRLSCESFFLKKQIQKSNDESLNVN